MTIKNKGTHVDWMYLDLNSYFASVEQQEYPDLRREPVAVVPMPTDATCAIAASYEAKAFGVKTGTKIYDAKQLCPNLKCVLARHDIYVEYHQKIIEEVVKYTPICKIWSIDEFSSKLMQKSRSVENAYDLGTRIKKGIWNNVGEVINCSIGFAPNSLLAKIAAEMNKPDGLTILTLEDLPGPLLDLKLTDIPGIGENMKKRLNRAGIWDMKGIWNLAPKQARKIWGSVQGERFWYLLRGHDIPTNETSTSLVGHSRMLDPDMRNPDAARQMARRLTIKAATRLRRKNFHAATFRLSVRTTDKRKWAKELRGSPKNDSMTFLKSLDQLWDQMIETLNPYRILKVSVTMYNLTPDAQVNYDLFETVLPPISKEKNERCSNVIETLNRNHGANTVSLGTNPKTMAGYVGTKIAFSRVPDKEEFWE